MTMHKHYPANTAGRDFVVGDIHGCMDEFAELLKRIGFDKCRDRMYATGDLCDRGPDSVGALALLAEPWFKTVRGNHEDMLVQVVRDGEGQDWWDQNGGAWARGCMREEMLEYAAQVEALPLSITVGEGEGRFNIVHAEFFGSDADLDAGDYSEHMQQRMMWGRGLINGEVEGLHDGLSITFCGHSIVPNVGRIGSQVYIDTGSYMPYWMNEPGALTVTEPITGALWQVCRRDVTP